MNFQFMSTLDLAVQRFKSLKEKLYGITSSNKVNVYQEKPIASDIYQPSKTVRNVSNQRKVSVSQSVRNHKKMEDMKKLTHGRGKSDQQIYCCRENKENERNRLNKNNSHKIYPKKTDFITIEIQQTNTDSQNPTEKKAKQKNNHIRKTSDNIVSYNSQSTQLQGRANNKCDWADDTRKLSSLNNSRATGLQKQLSEKEKTLEEINFLLERKKQVLQGMEKKIECSRMLRQSGISIFESGELIGQRNISRKRLKAPNLFQMQMEARRRGESKSMKIRWK